MKLSIKGILGFITLSAIFIATLTAEQYAAVQVGEALAALIVAISLSFPFWASTDSKPFAGTYAIVTGFILAQFFFAPVDNPISASIFRGYQFLMSLVESISGAEFEYFWKIRLFDTLKYFTAPLLGILGGLITTWFFAPPMTANESAEDN